MYTTFQRYYFLSSYIWLIDVGLTFFYLFIQITNNKKLNLRTFATF